MRDADVLQRLLAAQGEQTAQALESRLSMVQPSAGWDSKTHPPMYKLNSPDTLSRRDMVSLEPEDR